MPSPPGPLAAQTQTGSEPLTTIAWGALGAAFASAAWIVYDIAGRGYVSRWL